MKTSAERMLTTHVGSLPRTSTLKAMLQRRQAGRDIDTPAFHSLVLSETRDVVARQIQAGIDIIGDGELSRPGFQTYVPQRMTGFGGAARRRAPQDIVEFPELIPFIMRGQSQADDAEEQGQAMDDHPAATAEIEYDDLSEAQAELSIFEQATEGQDGRFLDRFVTAPSPGIIATTMPNQFYDSHERYVRAVAAQIAKEYRLIADKGLVLQIDAPDLAMERTIMYQDEPVSKYLEAIELYIEAINTALEGISRDQVRLHCCYGNYVGPHLHDIELKEILPLLSRAKVGGLSLELANPRHQHEVKLLQSSALPDEMVLLPGVIDTSTHYVEHPEVVADRICAAVDAVGSRERVIASTDCGFGTFISYEIVVPAIAWKKLESLSEGARIATRRLWGRS